MLRDLGGLFWRDDGHGLVVHVLLPLVRVRLEEGLSLVVVEELGVQLSAFLSVLRTLDLLDELEAAIPASKPSPTQSTFLEEGKA